MGLTGQRLVPDMPPEKRFEGFSSAINEEVAAHHFIAVNHAPCTGCRTCEVVCSLYHFGECRPERSAIHVIRREKDGLVFCLPLVCQQCEPAPCVEACPAGALCRDERPGILMVDKERCTACGLCADACPVGGISISTGGMTVISCDLCGGQPRCVPTCHVHCLSEVDSQVRSEQQTAAYLAGILEREHLGDCVPGKQGPW